MPRAEAGSGTEAGSGKRDRAGQEAGQEAGQSGSGSGSGSGTERVRKRDRSAIDNIRKRVRKRDRGQQEAGRVRYWQYGQAEKSPDLAISDPSRFLSRTRPASSHAKNDALTPDFLLLAISGSGTGDSRKRDGSAIGNMGKQKSRLT